MRESTSLDRPGFFGPTLERVFGSLLSKGIAASRDSLGEFVRRLLPESPVRTTLVVFTSPSLHEPLGLCQRREPMSIQGEITAKLLEARSDSLRSKLRNIRSFVVTRMQDLRAVLNSDVGHVRAELAKHIDQITLTPTGVCRLGYLEFCWAWQYRWCRGTGMHDTATSWLLSRSGCLIPAIKASRNPSLLRRFGTPWINRF